MRFGWRWRGYVRDPNFSLHSRRFGGFVGIFWFQGLRACGDVC